MDTSDNKRFIKMINLYQKNFNEIYVRRCYYDLFYGKASLKDFAKIPDAFL